MEVDRIRRVQSKKEMENIIDDYVTLGYEILSRGETTCRLQKNDSWGTVVGHLVVLILTWWSCGVGNLIYGLAVRKKGEVVFVKLEKQE